MSKYAPLAKFLRNAPHPEVPMSFVEIEKLIGHDLPASSRKYPAWWSNNPSNNVMTRAWLDAGFQTERVDVPRARVVFRRVRGRPSGSPDDGSSPVSRGARRHRIFGCMAGSITTSPGVDLTAPADPAWGART